ncbi:MAG: type I polyketide synthase, partial [Proteobacteria bacterium]|nr:type I polyketide synthase [Pseudomonadota bacterium]
AGYLNNDYDHRDTGIVLGHSTYLHRGQGNLIQHQLIVDQTKELLQAVLPSLDKDKLSAIIKMLEDKLPPFNPDIVPGLVPNVMTGRIANRLNLRGPNYLIDAACSSSLLAVGAAIDELRNGRSRIMMAGGVNASLPAEVSVIFTQLGALSKRGKVRPFETGSDGTLLGEGLGVIVLKRISDAIDDGDRMYAVIHGVGQATGSRKYGILAPSVEGEVLAIERAYKASGIDPATIELIEAHGTGIPLGDKTEIAALKRILGERKGKQGSVAIGSVKSMISHCIPAAGIAGIIKSALALHHKILPPTLCEDVSSELDIESTPLYINTTTRPWISQPLAPRRAGINSFGFGGINAHAILEEAPEHAAKPLKLSGWPFELCVFSAESIEELGAKIKQTARLLEMHPACAIGDIAAALASQETNKQYRLAMVVKDTKDFAKKIEQTLKRCKDNSDVRWATRNGIMYSNSPLEGKLAFIFPGEGSQYINMLADLALFFDEVRNWFDFWKGLYEDAPGDARTDIVFPPPSGLTEQRSIELEERLHNMDVGSEAVFIGGQAMHTLLKSFGVKPDVMVGHSSGESSALAASGAIASDDLSHLADFILQLNKIYQRVMGEGKIPTGALLTVGALSKTIVEEHIASLNKEIVIAMENCPNQLVLYGAKESIEALQSLLISSGGICIPLPFDRGYHTPQFSAVSDAFLNYYKDIGLSLPSVPLYSCATADLFPKNKQGVRKLAAGQWSKKVRFEETVKKMYEDGVRFFIEVGPSGNLSAFINDILSKKECLCLATNQRQKNSVEQFLTVLAHLYVNAKEVQLEKLFCSRSCTTLNLQEGLPQEQPGMRLSNTMPMIHLTDENRTFLQELLAGESKTNHGPQTPFLPVDSCNELKADNLITADYFNHMRNFLDQQHKVLQYPEISLPPLSREINSVD